jgi:hypothetical protein
MQLKYFVATGDWRIAFVKFKTPSLKNYSPIIFQIVLPTWSNAGLIQPSNSAGIQKRDWKCLEISGFLAMIIF